VVLNLVLAHSAQRKSEVLKHLVRSQKWFWGAHPLLTSDYGLNLPLLMKALKRCVANHAARNELSRRLLTTGSGKA